MLYRILTRNSAGEHVVCIRTGRADDSNRTADVIDTGPEVSVSSWSNQMEQTDQFLNLLYGALVGETLEFRLVDKSGGQATRRIYVPYPLPDQTLESLASWNEAGYNIYFGVATRRGVEVDLVPALWIDVDFKDFDAGYLSAETTTKLRLFGADMKPSIVVHSGNGIHAYWLLDEAVGPEKHKDVELLNRKLAMLFSGDSVGDAPRILRLPGFFNTKDRANPVPCTVLSADPIWYNLSELEEWLARIPVRRVGKKIEVLIKEGNTGQYASRSEADFAVVCSLVKAGYSDDDIRTIFETEQIGSKYREKGMYSEGYLTNTIEAARTTVGE